jgi:hypothetical protein
MVSTQVLALPDFKLPFAVETNTCDDGIEAILMQQGRPIAYLSKALGVRKPDFLFMKKEFIALIMAVDRWWALFATGRI